MPTTTDYLKYTNLQLAAEAFLVNKDGTVKADIAAALEEGNGHASRFTATEAASFSKQWAVLDQCADTSTGFSGTVFKNRVTGELVISFRSTEFIDDEARDSRATNELEIKDTGYAWGQIRDMEDWYARLTAAGGPLAGNQPFSITGYSLGGHLATVFNLLHGSEGRIQQVVTFNGAGVGAVAQGASLATLVSEFTGWSKNADGHAFTFGDPNLAALYERARQAYKNEGSGISAADRATLEAMAFPSADSGMGPDLQARQVLQAVQRIDSIRAEVDRLKSMTSGDGHIPAQVPDSDIGQEDLDYQMAVLKVSASTSAASLAGGFMRTIGDKVYAHPSYPVASQFDVVADTSPSMVSNSQWHIGTSVRVPIEDQPLYRGGDPGSAVWASLTNFGVKLLVDGYATKDFGDTHSLVLLVDSLAVQNTFLQLIATGQRETASQALGQYMKDASDQRTQNGATISGSNQGKAEGDVLENMVNALSSMLGAGATVLKGNPNGGTWADVGGTDGYTGRTALYDALKTIQASDAYKAILKLGTAQLTAPPQTGSAARQDFGAFLSLVYAAPFALKFSGDVPRELHPDLYAKWNDDKALTATQRAQGLANFTDEYLSARADFLQRVLYYNDKNARYDKSGGGTQAGDIEATRYDDGDVVWIDQPSGIRIQRTAEVSPSTTQYVEFGGDAADTLDGGGRDDRLFGGAGDDVLRGKSGNDVLEGNDGNDTLDGGSGNDSLAGGAGQDSYVFASAWGKDIIVDDAKGEGSLTLDGTQLSGGQGTGDSWAQSLADGRTVRYKVMTDAGSSTGKQLVITVDGDAADSISVKNFDLKQAQGDSRYLGIKLGPQQVAVKEGGGDSFWSKPSAKLDELAGKTSGLGAGQTFTVYLSQAAHDGEELVLNVSGLASSALKSILGDETVDANGATIALSEGQTEVSFALFASSDTPSADAGQLSVTLHDADGSGTAVTSNSWSLTVDAKPDPTKTFTGDFTKKSVNNQYPLDANGNYIADDSNPSSPGANDLITGTDQADHIQGLGGNDALFGGAGDDVIDGGDGVDVIEGGLGADTLNGGDGNDVIYGSSTGGVVKPLLVGSENFASSYPIVASGFGWNITSNGTIDDNGLPLNQITDTVSRDEQFGDAGNVINAGAGDDSVYAGTGDDRVSAGDGADLVYGMGGSDVLLGQGGDDYILGDGSAQDSTVLTYTPADQHGQDFIDGGDGNDTLIGQGNDDVLYGGLGNDQLWGDDSNLTRTPASVAGNDYLDGEEGDDTLVGGAKDDTLYGGDGSDVLWGDGGQFMPGDARYLDPSYSGNDYLDGEAGDDTLVGQGGDDTLYGGTGNDLLEGDDNSTTRLPAQYNGNDYLDGEEGADTLIGGGGNDTLHGGADNDLLYGDVASADSKTAAAPGDGDDYLDGEDGDDQLIGGGGNDTLYGGGGNDTLWGGAGDDDLDGGDGDDTLYAADGNDTLDGGAGNNVYVIQTGTGDISIDSTSDTDVVQFGDGIALANISGTADSDGFTLNLSATQSLSIAGSTSFVFADGTQLDAAGMTAYLAAHAPVDPPPPLGTTTTNLVDSDGQAAGSVVKTVEASRITTTYYDGQDGTGAKTYDTWTTTAGGSGSDTFAADGSSNGIAFNVDQSFATYADDGQGNRTNSSFDATGLQTADSWTKSDGSHGSDTFNADGSSTGIAYSADGSYKTYTDDGQGHVTTLAFDAAGHLVPTEARTTFADGSYQIRTDDHLGNVTFTLYGADGVKRADSWVKADHTHGTDSFAADGSTSGSFYNTDGSYKTFSSNTTGKTITSNFSAQGALIGSTVEEAHGLNRVISQLDASGQKVSETWVHPDGSTGADVLGPLPVLPNLVAQVDAAGFAPDVAWVSADGRSRGSLEYANSSDRDNYSDIWDIYGSNGGSGMGGEWVFDVHGSDALGYHMDDLAAPGSSQPDFFVDMDYQSADRAIAEWNSKGSPVNQFPEILNYEFEDNVTGVNVFELVSASGERYFGLRASAQDAGSARSPMTQTFNGNGGYDVLQEDGLGNGVFTRYSVLGTRLADMWYHNDGSYGVDSYHADGSSAGVSINPAMRYYEFTKDANGNVTSLIGYPGEGATQTIARPYSPPPQSISPAPAPAHDWTPIGGSTQSAVNEYAAPNGIVRWTSSPIQGTQCDDDVVFYNARGEVVSRVTVHTDPGYELAVPQAAGTAGWRYDPAGVAQERYVDDGQGTVTTWHYDAQQRVLGHDVAVTASDSSVTTQKFGVANQLLGFSKTTHPAQGETRIDNFDAAGRPLGYSDEFADGHGNSMLTSYDASGHVVGSQATIVDDTGYRTVISSYDASGASTGSVITTTVAGTGIIQTDTYDANGQLVGSVVASQGSNGDGVTTNYDASSAVTSVVRLSFSSDGVPTLATFDAQGRKMRQVTLTTDGEQLTTEYATGGSTTTTATAVDGSFSVSVRDAAGNQTTSSFTPAGVKTADTWTRQDGSHGSDVFAADGSSTGQATYADGTSASFVTGADGTQTVTYLDSAGAVTGSAVTVKLADVTDVTRYDASGAPLSERWWDDNGAFGSTDWTDPAAIRSEIHNADGTWQIEIDDHQGDVTTTFYAADGSKTSDTWTSADGSTGATSYAADGSYTTTVNDIHGKTTVTQYSSAGERISDTWTDADGSYGSDTFDGANGMGDAYYTDGSHKVLQFWDDGSGKSVLYDAAGNDVRDEWWNSDGTSSWAISTYDATGFMTGDTFGGNDGSASGFDVYNADGTSYGETDYADGSCYKYTGTANGSSWQQSDGSHGTQSWNSSGYGFVDQIFYPDGTSVTQSAGQDQDGVFWSKTVYYDVNGAATHDIWNSGGLFWADTFNADGSSTGTTTDRWDNLVSSYVNDGAGDITTTYFDASGAATGDSWARADGSHGTTTFNADGTISGTRVNADGTTASFSNASRDVTVGQPIADQTAHQDAVWTYTVPAGTFYEADFGDMLTYSASLADGSALPSWLSFDARTRTFTGTPPAGALDSGLGLKVTATNTEGATANDVFQLANDRPAGPSIVGTAGNDTLVSQYGIAETVYGEAGNDTLTAYGDNDTLEGGAGDDLLQVLGTPRGTTFIGGAGNDRMNGSYWGDTYIFNVGDGQDTIWDNDTGYGATDVLRFGTGIAPSDVAVVHNGADVIFKVGAGGDQVTVQGWLGNGDGWTQLEQIKFADGTVWTKQQLDTQLLDWHGTAGNDTMTGVYAFAETLHGDAGNDHLTAYGSGDTLDGGSGDDLLDTTGNSSGTTFIGGTGNDRMNGSYWADTYIFNAGDGQDTIWDNDTGYGSTDVLQFGTGIAPSDVCVVRNGADVIFKVGAGGDQVTVQGWLGNRDGWTQLEQIKFADGTVWTKQQVNAQLLDWHGTAGNDTMTGVYAFSETLHGDAGNDHLTAYGSGDTLDGGSGDDLLDTIGNTNGTTFIGGTGNDTMIGSYWNDTYIFNVGDGQDTIREGDGGYTATDVLQFGVGIAPDDVTITRNGTDVTFKVGANGDQVTVQNWLWDTSNQLEQIKFADGTTWTKQQLDAQLLDWHGTAGNDTMSGVWSFAETLHGDAGNDHLSAYGTGDTLDGGSGDDVLDTIGYANGTTFMGGTGNDTMYGSYWNDTYIFNAGDGQDTIQDNSAGNTATDVLQFGAGISDDQLWFRKVNNSLEISIIGTTDKVTIAGWYDTPMLHIENIQLANGQTLLDTQVQNLVDAMASFSVPATTTLSPDYHNALDATLAANWH